MVVKVVVGDFALAIAESPAEKLGVLREGELIAWVDRFDRLGLSLEVPVRRRGVPGKEEGHRA